MRFGIMTMQIGTLIPPDLAAENAIAHLQGFSLAALVRTLAEDGFHLLELGGDLSLFLPQTYQPESISTLAKLKDELGLSYTTHLPLWSVEPSSPLEPVRKGSVEAVKHIIQATQPLKPEVYVLHATGALAAEFYRMRLSDLAKSLLLRMFAARAQQSIEAILKETGLPSRRLAIETVEFPFALTWNLAEELDLSLCLDTGHVLSGFSGEISIEEALEACLPRLAEVHLHDSPAHKAGEPIQYGRDHKPLGQGDLDVGWLLDRLQEAGFDGPIIFELQKEEALASLATVRQLRPALVNS
jgi:sugar phosphate isomerase/epimerase